MKNQMSYKLDNDARLWVRPTDGTWRLSTADEADRFYLCYPEMAAQAFWIGRRPRKKEPAVTLAA